MPPFSLHGRRHGYVATLNSTSPQELWAVRRRMSSNTVSLTRSYSTCGTRLSLHTPFHRGSLFQRNSAAQSSAPNKAAQLAQRLHQSPWGGNTTLPSPENVFHEGSAAGWTSPHNTASRASKERAAVPSFSSSFDCQLQRKSRRPFPTSFSHTVVTAERVSNDDTAANLVSLGLTWSVGSEMADVQDDDVVLDTPTSLLPCMAAATQELKVARQRQRCSSFHQPQQGEKMSCDSDVVTPENNEFSHPAARGVGQDVIDLVTDVFTAQREAEVQRRREVLYKLTHPDPIDYTYNGKLVPPPPLSFGQVTEEARSLGNKMMLGETYSLVRQAGTRASEDDFCGAIYKVSSKNTSGKTTVAPSATIETTISGPSSPAFVSRHRKAPYRSRAREDNIFRDHNYFFEVNDLYQEIVLVGKACAGKSSLLNSLLGQNVAKTSSNPNTTRKISFYQSITPEQLHAFHAKEHHNQLVKLPGGGLQLTFVDMPGYGIEGMSDQWRDAAIELTDAYFGVRRSVNTVLYCMDCERGLTKTDIKYFEWLENVQGTFFVVLTKCDSVPHSRITSVMRQVYTLITKHRRKYRKVFPFIIPTSAKDGTNMELLRGLITETSGMIPGDKLRDMLKQKNEAFTQAALLREANRIDAARQLERAQAREFFRITRGSEALKNGAAAPREDKEMLLSLLNDQVNRLGSEGERPMTPEAKVEQHVGQTESAASADGFSRLSFEDSRRARGPQKYVLGLGRDSAEVAETLFLSGEGASSTPSVFPTAAMAEETAAQVRRERRQRFLAWRQAHPLATVEPSYDEPAAWTRAEKITAGGTDASSSTSSPQRHFGDQSSTENVFHPMEAVKEERSNRHRAETAAATPRQGNGRRYRLHTGLDNPQAAQTVLNVPGDAEMMTLKEGGTAEVPPQRAVGEIVNLTKENVAKPAESVTSSPPSLPTVSTRSSVLGFTPGLAGAAPPFLTHNGNVHDGSVAAGISGSISRFFDILDDFSQQPNTIKTAKQRRKEAQWQRKQKGKKGGGFLAQDPSGRLSSYQAGKPCGPALVSPDTSLDSRQAKWRAEKLKELITKENPEAPWLALQQLRRKLQARQEDAALSGMRKKEAIAYVRDAGRITESFEKFEGEVTATKYMNEVRQAPTLRSQQQMHLNATAKINYRSMPPGLWKRYGEKETYWPTPRVLGRAHDESHRP